MNLDIYYLGINQYFIFPARNPLVQKMLNGRPILSLRLCWKPLGSERARCLSIFICKKPCANRAFRGGSALTHSVVYGGNPITTHTFDERSVVVLLANCNLYGFTGMQGKHCYGYGNLSQMWKFMRNHLPLHCLCRWSGASCKEGKTFSYSTLQLLF